MSLQNSICGCPGFQSAPRSRREFLQTAGLGIGWLALTDLLAKQSRAEILPSHFAPKAKHVIFCFMDGGPSHVDTFDYKPELKKREGEKIGDSAVSKLSQSSASRV